MNLEFEKIAQEAHQIAREKGFWPAGPGQDRNQHEMLMLIVSELGEAMEAHRKGLWPGGKLMSNRAELMDVIAAAPDGNFAIAFEAQQKDTFGDELADAVIRIGDMIVGIGAPPKDDEAWAGKRFAESKYLASGYINVGQVLLGIVRSVAEYYEGVNQLASNLHKAVGELWFLSELMDVNLNQCCLMKMRYNRTRAKLHGKQY